MIIKRHTPNGTMIIDNGTPRRISQGKKKKSLNYLGLMPKLPFNMTWVVVSYVHGKEMRKPNGMTIKEDFGFVSYLKQSGAYHHLLTESGATIICTIGFKTKPEIKLIKL